MTKTIWLLNAIVSFVATWVVIFNLWEPSPRFVAATALLALSMACVARYFQQGEWNPQNL